MPTIRVDHLTPEQIPAHQLADNHLAELSDWDEEFLALELQGLAGLELDFELEVVGFATEEIDEFSAGPDDPDEDQVEDEPPQPQGRAVTRRGDLWQLGSHRVLCGDLQ